MALVFFKVLVEINSESVRFWTFLFGRLFIAASILLLVIDLFR
jgi:hypothetical protein